MTEPAYPLAAGLSPAVYGISLRDFFAAAIVSNNSQWPFGTPEKQLDEWADHVYRMADALVRRSERGE